MSAPGDRAHNERRAKSVRFALAHQGSPGAALERKHDLIGQAVLILVRDYGVVPGWIDELRAEVEAGRL